MGVGLQETGFDLSFWTLALSLALSLGGAVVRQFQGTKPSFSPELPVPDWKISI